MRALVHVVPAALRELLRGMPLSDGKVGFAWRTAVGPAKAYTKEIAVPAGIDEHDLRASISVNGKELVAYSPIRLKPQPMPKAVTPPPPPAQIKTFATVVP